MENIQQPTSNIQHPVAEKASGGSRPLDLSFMVEWIPASQPPTGAQENRVYCVSTPKCEGREHQLARWDKRGWWASAWSPMLVEGVTYYCDLPFSPEWIAAHEDDFAECDFSDHPVACAGPARAIAAGSTGVPLEEPEPAKAGTPNPAEEKP